MDIAVTRHGDEVIVAVSGRVDTNAAESLDLEVAEIPSNVKTIIFDLENMSYIASSGLRVLLATLKNQKAKQGRVIIRKPNELVMEVFNATGFSEIFEFDK